jgi:hypothetical protein
MASDGAAKAAESFMTAFFVGTAAASMGPLLVGIAIKEAVGFIVGPLLMEVFAVPDQLAHRVEKLERRVDQMEARLDERLLQVQELLLRNIGQFANVAEPVGPEQIQYMRSQIGAAAPQPENEMLNAKGLGELNSFRVDLLLVLAEGVQPGGAFAARKHLGACLDQVGRFVAKHQAELANAKEERKRPPPSKTRKVEGIRHVRGFEAGSGRFHDVYDGPGEYSWPVGFREGHVQMDATPVDAGSIHARRMRTLTHGALRIGQATFRKCDRRSSLAIRRSAAQGCFSRRTQLQATRGVLQRQHPPQTPEP